MLKDPISMYTRAAAAAFGRYTDEKIIAGLGDIVYSGKEGNTSINNYDVGECRLIDSDGVEVTAGSDHSDTVATYLTVAKVALIGKIMDEASIPSANRHIVANGVNKWKFLQESDVKTYDVNTIKALAAGTLTDFMGFHFHWLPTARFSYNATDTEAIDCYAYHSDAAMLSRGTGEHASKDRITEDPTHVYNMQAYMMRMISALRLQGPGVVEICLKAA